MAQSTNEMTLLLHQEDANGVAILNRVIGAISYAGGIGQFQIGDLEDTSAHSQTFPSTVSTVNQFYFKNTSTTQFITVTWTHTTGASCIPQAVPPGGILLFWNPVVTSPAGITALSLQADVASATFEMFLGGA
jgi:hypothetical protein